MTNVYNIHDMNVLTGLPILQVNVTPSSPIIVHASVKVKDCYAESLWQQSFQLEKVTIDQHYLDTELEC